MKRPPNPALRRRLRAMSVIEVLVAAALLLVISLGILALLTRALANNSRGWEATSAANLVRSQLDTTLGEPFGSDGVQVAVGNAETKTERFWANGSPVIDNDAGEKWYDTEAEAQGLILMHQTRTVRQYHVILLLGDPTGFSDDGEFVYEIDQSRIDSGLPGGTASEYVNLRRVDVSFEGTRAGGGLGAGQRLKAETYKAY